MVTERDYLEAVAGRCNPLDDDKCFDCKAVTVAALYVKQLQDENKKLEKQNSYMVVHWIPREQRDELQVEFDELKKDIELSDKLCPIGLTNTCGYWAKQQKEIDKLKNDIIDIEDDLSWHKAIFDGSWPQAVEILERTLAKVKAIKGGE